MNQIRPDEAAQFGGVGAQTQEKIELRRLDDVWSDVVDGASRVFLKIDTQGHDTEVILGTKEHLRSVVGILSEVPVIELYEGMPSMPDTIKTFRDAGFRPVGFYPVNFGYNGAVAEFDVIFARI